MMKENFGQVGCYLDWFPETCNLKNFFKRCLKIRREISIVDEQLSLYVYTKFGSKTSEVN